MYRKISDVVKALQALEAEHGDLDVFVTISELTNGVLTDAAAYPANDGGYVLLQWIDEDDLEDGDHSAHVGLPAMSPDELQPGDQLDEDGVVHRGGMPTGLLDFDGVIVIGKN